MFVVRVIYSTRRSHTFWCASKESPHNLVWWRNSESHFQISSWTRRTGRGILQSLHSAQVTKNAIGKNLTGEFGRNGFGYASSCKWTDADAWAAFVAAAVVSSVVLSTLLLMLVKLSIVEVIDAVMIVMVVARLQMPTVLLFTIAVVVLGAAIAAVLLQAFIQKTGIKVNRLLTWTNEVDQSEK